jgi:hypothetical protein
MVGDKRGWALWPKRKGSQTRMFTSVFWERWIGVCKEYEALVLYRVERGKISITKANLLLWNLE